VTTWRGRAAGKGSACRQRRAAAVLAAAAAAGLGALPAWGLWGCLSARAEGALRLWRSRLSAQVATAANVLVLCELQLEREGAGQIAERGAFAEQFGRESLSLINSPREC